MSRVPAKKSKQDEKSSSKQPSSTEKDWLLEESSSLSPEDPIRSLMNLKPYKRSEDTKGHNITISANFPKSYDRGIVRLKEFDGSPYELKSDVIRDAIYIGLQVLNMRYSLDPEWQIEKRLAEQRSHIQDQVRIQEVVHDVVDDLAQFSTNGNKDVATEHLTDFIGTVSKLGEEKKKIYMQALRRRLKQTELDSLLEAVSVEAS